MIIKNVYPTVHQDPRDCLGEDVGYYYCKNCVEYGDILKVEYNRDKSKTDETYVHRNIAKRSFNLGWRISRRFDKRRSYENNQYR